MKPLLIALFLLFPALAYGGPTCNASAVIVQGIARDRDNGVPLQQEIFNANVALEKIGLLTESNMAGMEIVVRSVYQSSMSPSTIVHNFLNNCKEPQ